MMLALIFFFCLLLSCGGDKAQNEPKKESSQASAA
jgi:hypothetical protein